MTEAARTFPNDWPDEWPKTAENLAAYESARNELRHLVEDLPPHIREGKYLPRDLFTPDQYNELQALGYPRDMIEYSGALRLAHGGLHRNTTDGIRTAWKAHEARELSKKTGKIGKALIAEIVRRYEAGDFVWRRWIGAKSPNSDSVRKWLPEITPEDSEALQLLLPVALTVARNFYDPGAFVESREGESKADFENRCRVARVKISHETLADELADLCADPSEDNLYEYEQLDRDFLANLDAARAGIEDASAENILALLRPIPIGKLLSGD